jgi:hypothetical protein
MLELMKVMLFRQGLVLEGAGKTVPLTAAVNDVLGLRDEWPYAVHLRSRYGSFWPDEWIDLPEEFDTSGLDEHELASEAVVAQIQRIQSEARELRRQKLPDRFLAACRQATEGHLSVSLAPLLERVLYRPGAEADEIPNGDLATLAAWSLDQTLRLFPIEIRECQLCHLPWLSPPQQASHNCERPYPGRAMSCRALKKDEHFRESQRDWRREYKRLYERRKRGTLSEADWDAWRAENSHDAWYPFDEWNKRRIPIVGADEEKSG